jgi:hypothetical protein
MEDRMSLDDQPPRRPDLTPSERIGDAERARAATRLSDHYAAGRLDRTELDVRTEAALTARTAAELEPLFRDLPGGDGRPTPAPARQLRRRPFVVPLLPLTILIVVIASLADGSGDGHGGFPFFFIFPLLWFSGAFRHRWHR